MRCRLYDELANSRDREQQESGCADASFTEKLIALMMQNVSSHDASDYRGLLRLFVWQAKLSRARLPD